MGWLKLGARAEENSTINARHQTLKDSTEHIEDAAALPVQRSYPFAESSLPELSLPFIPDYIVSRHISAETGGLCSLLSNLDLYQMFH